MGAVSVGYKCHGSRHLASGGQWLGIGWAPWRGGGDTFPTSNAFVPPPRLWDADGERFVAALRRRAVGGSRGAQPCDVCSKFLGATVLDDTIFWMKIEDFAREYDAILTTKDFVGAPFVYFDSLEAVEPGDVVCCSSL